MALLPLTNSSRKFQGRVGFFVYFSGTFTSLFQSLVSGISINQIPLVDFCQLPDKRLPPLKTTFSPAADFQIMGADFVPESAAVNSSVCSK